MKKIFLSLAIVGLMLSVSCKNETPATEEPVAEEPVATTPVEETAFTPDYKIDATSVIDWTGSKPAGKHTGTIALKEGGFTVADGKVTGGKFVIDMNSITVTDLTGDDKASLEGHLKGTGEKEKEDHFFNVAQFPTGEFTIKSFENGTVTGDLTLKGKTNEVSFPADVVVSETEVTLTSKSFKIDRTKWGVNYASKSVFDDLKDKFVNDEIELVVKVKATK